MNQSCPKSPATRIGAFILFAALLWAAHFATAAEDSFSNPDPIQAFLNGNFANTHAGMVAGLVDENGSRVFSAGKLDNGTETKVDGDTIFEIGSVTKVFTSLLALEMARRGEIVLDDPVAKYLPERVRIPGFEGKEITLRHLAAQESGLPFHPDSIEKVLDWASGKPRLKEFKAACDAYTAEDLYAFLASHQLASAPGSRFQYSNTGMALLGHAMALKAGTSYEALVVERIARPLAMMDTGIARSPEQETRLARGHWADGTPSENVRFQVQASAGALSSTANDLLKFLSAILGFTRNDLAPCLEEMQIVRHTGDPRFGRTAMPWMDEGMYQPPGSDLLGHGGGGLGYLAFIGFDRKLRRGVVVLTNQLVMNPAGVGWTILQGMSLSRENVTYFVREIVGLGVALGPDQTTGATQITSVYPRSPAGQAGLKAGLLIQRINGASVEGKSVQYCLKLMAGPPGAKIQLELLDPANGQTRAVDLERRKFVTATD